MDTKIVRLSGSTQVETRLSKWFKTLCANQVLYECQAVSKKDIKGFYLGFMRDLKLLRVYGVKRVLSRS